VNSKNFISEFKTYLLLGLKFGLTGALIGFILHGLWDNIEEITYTVINGFIIGFFVGFFELIFSNSKAARLPYALLLFFRTILYFLIAIISIYTLLIFYLKSNGLASTALADPEKFTQIKSVYFLTNINAIYLLLFILLASFFYQLKSFFSKGVLFNYLIGRYHKPSSEDRIFMFLDLNDATTLAEKLGARKYSAFLSDFFIDLDSAFTKTRARVFQYVGDEVVIMWNPRYGLKNNNCVNAYFFALDIIADKKQYYLNSYDVVPTFKAALHYGEVTITEIGVSKKEIAYHGDTMNTTARICASAHRLDKQILISRVLCNKLSKNDTITFEDLGTHMLKGKDERIHLFSIYQQSNPDS